MLSKGLATLLRHGPQGRSLSEKLKDFLRHNKVAIHLGAHKTATTYIQSTLNAQRKELRSAGVAVVVPSDLRSTGVLQRTMMPDCTSECSAPAAANGPDLLALLSDLAADPDTRRIAVSEEGFIGAPRNNLARKSLYPDLANNLAYLPDVLDHPNVTFLFALRDYGSFFSSNVTTTVRRGNFFNLEKLRVSLLMLHRSWMDVVSELCDAFPAAAFKIWQFEQFPALESRVFSEFAPGFVPASSDRIFETLSDKAMQLILDRAGAESDPEATRSVVQTAIRAFPVSDSNPPFSMWSEEESKHLSLRYTLDWQAICTRYPGISLKVE